MIRRFIALAIVPAAVASIAAAAPESFGTGVSLKEATPIERHHRAAVGVRREDRPRRRHDLGRLHRDGLLDGAGARRRQGRVDLDDQGRRRRDRFPVSAKGKRAAAQGVVQRVGGDHESHSAAAEHAKAQGKDAPVAWQSQSDRGDGLLTCRSRFRVLTTRFVFKFGSFDTRSSSSGEPEPEC